MPENFNLSQFPITPYLEQICNALKDSPSRFLILTAETAAGKSTVLPLALLEHFSGKILMTEPRRIAVLGVSNRLGELAESGSLGQTDCGNPIGYKIHLESKITRDTRLEVVTEAILVRQLQSDPALEDYNVVVLDEFHERSVNTDLSLAFLKEAMQLRDDLFVVIMSATIDTKRLQNYLGTVGEVPVFSVPGRQFPVKVLYEPEKSVVAAVKDVLRSDVMGNILVFLPGIADIRKAQEALLETGDFDADSDTELCVLHSSVSLEEQKRVIKPPYDGEDAKRRVILSSAIAETSLTVPGVTTVIDSGLARINRMDLNTGMEKLSTEVESEFSAEQRKGRAGRICEGTCIRLWDEHDPRVKELAPEILRTDLVPVVLECSERGVYSVEGIDWLDSPSKAAWKTSSTLLRQLGLIRDDGHLTEKGRTALTLGVHPRLGSIALEAFDNGTGRLSEEGRELLLKFSNYSGSSRELQNRFIADMERRLKACNYVVEDKSDFLILSGYPDRLAMRTSAPGVEPAEYKFAGGRQARLYKSNAPVWLVAPEVMAKNADAVIFDFAELPEAKIGEFLEKNCEIREICSFAHGTLQKFEQKCYGEIVLSSKKVPTHPEDFAEAWVTEITEKGFDSVPKDARVESLLLRAEFIEQQKDEGIDKEACGLENSLYSRLSENVREWLIPFLSGSNTLTPQIVYDALYWYLNGSEIDREAPEQLVLENGRRVKVKYEKQAEIRPIIEIIIQRIFGCFTTPQICGKKVLLRLLSPASRPLQVTEDLEHFWTGAWVEICKEMKGRYPKHNWDLPKIEEPLKSKP
ncbi:ATP-dependent helicase HrpB [Treponema bryantii]|uniref:ATP-dependent helicase HrpB n=1 Tax=Treponema bryantii TaxID=163 RepID=A0A1H9H457_9SPIR|nr:ATP-dependent helicase C-terminal domain-containing protein [Treponema bryantii]SEQ57018.1 ATP-dependent helicase HrpB [Treponema bryantii]